MSDSPWGSDGIISVPQPRDSTDMNMVDMEGFCFTPDGLRINLTHSEKEDLLRSGRSPEGNGVNGQL